MPGNPNNLLHDPWLTALDAHGHRQTLTLPQLLARLGSGEEIDFPALQGHQQQAWYAFLVQLCTMALHRSGGTLDQDVDAWTRDLDTLGAGTTAWHLVVDDLQQPAFFQPPVPEGDLGKFKRRSSSPEILEVLIAAKNHDIKADRFSTAVTEHWVFALLTLQTMEGFLGRGNYGIARMNGGFSSRPETAYASDTRWTTRLRRDVDVLRRQRSELLDSPGYSDSGIPLLWVLPWQGTPAECLGLGDLDPFYLEVCRRVRLLNEQGQVVAGVAPSDAARINAKDFNGNVGDPWTPIRSNGTALTVSENGFHYRLISELLLDGDYSPSAALEVQPGEQGDMLALFRVLVRGQGKTGGFHERQIPIPAKVFSRWGKLKPSLVERSRWRIEQVGTMQKKVLKPALLMLVQERVQAAEGSGLNFKDDRAAPWLDRFDRWVDEVFFEQLFRDAAEDLNTEDSNDRWRWTLHCLARQAYDEASEVLAPSGIHRHRALARSKSFLEAQLRKVEDLVIENLPESPTPPPSNPHLDPSLEAST